MIELPEAFALADQMTERLQGRRIRSAAANSSPHKFAWFYGEPAKYADILAGGIIGPTRAFGGNVETEIGDYTLLIHDGATPRFFGYGEKRPDKHQLLIQFVDDSALTVTVRMYGGIYLSPKGEDDNPYRVAAKTKPSPLSDEFDWQYFYNLTQYKEYVKHSAKAFLATEQRIPGLGNGVLQDILWNAGIHPKAKMGDLAVEELEKLYETVKSLLLEMTIKGGRDTEKNLLGENGGYITQMGKNTSGKPCPVCGSEIQKQAYMGGSVYFCAKCQKF